MDDTLDTFSRNSGPENIDLPQSTTILVLGILSIITCFCYGIPGVILGIVALVQAKKARQLYNQSPEAWSQSSYNNMNAGRICAIIGTVCGGLYLVIILAYIAIMGSLIGLQNF